MPRFTIGSDPEFPLVDRYNVPRSAIGRLASKEAPVALACGGMFYADNLNSEGQVPPATSKVGFASNVANMLLDASAVAERSGLRLIVQASTIFPASEFENDKAFEVGCRAEYCVYNVVRGRIKRVPPPVFDRTSRLRSCGGHLHIGWEQATIDRVGVIKALDLVAGVACVLMDNDPTSARRRTLYGGAGYHRPTDYGVEWRTPGNFWLAHPDLVGIIWGLVDESLFLTYQEFKRPPEDAIVRCINTHDKALARELWDGYVRPVLSRSLAVGVEEVSERAHETAIEKGWKIKKEHVA